MYTTYITTSQASQAFVDLVDLANTLGTSEYLKRKSARTENATTIPQEPAENKGFVCLSIADVGDLNAHVCISIVDEIETNNHESLYVANPILSKGLPWQCSTFLPPFLLWF